MRITIKDRGEELERILRERLAAAAGLVCAEHDQAVVALTIHGRENGWFDSQWTTCCQALEQKATAILKERC